MSFLNVSLLIGIAAAAVPIALHLLSRREPRHVVFPSIRFLTQRYQTNRARLQVRRWWLLALRVAALAALAIALAQPTIARSLSLTWLSIGVVAAVGVALLVMASLALARGGRRGTGGGLAAAGLLTLLAAGGWGLVTAARGPALATDPSVPTALAIVLDNGPHAAWATDEDNRLARLQRQASWVVARLPRSSRVAIIDRSEQLASFSLDVSSALARIEQLRPLEVAQPITTRLQAAVALLRTSDLPHRQVLVVTDLTRSAWPDTAAGGRLASSLAEDPPIPLTVLDLGPMQGLNRSLAIPQLADSTPPRGQSVPVTTTVAVTGTDRALSVTAELELYEQDPSLPVVRDANVIWPPLRSVDRSNVQVTATQPQQILLNLPALDVGTHHGRIRLIGDDAQPLDDARYLTLQVLPPQQVLLVADQPDEARVISQTIAPPVVGNEDAEREYVVERIAYNDLPVVRLEDFPVVVLIDPPRSTLSDRALAEYVAGGGGLLLALGPSAGTAALTSPLLAPLVRRWRVPEPGTFFQVTGAPHPVTQPLAADTPWSDFRVAQYWQSEPGPQDRVLMRYAGTDHAAVLTRTIDGDGGAGGRVLTITTPLPALAKATRPWNQLFGLDGWPAWLLVRQSVEHLAARGRNPRMADVGSPLLISTEKPAQAEKQEDAAVARLQLFPPASGLPVPLEVPPAADQIVIENTSRSGTYWIRGLAIGEGFSVNLPSARLDRERIDPSALDALLGEGGYALVTSKEAIEFATAAASQGVPLFSLAMLLVLAVFVLEQILSNRFYRQPRVAAAAIRTAPVSPGSA